ncbi:U4/U6 small nuclear ribonucleoprotein Prp31-like [Corticium candelabrum]|uniref:U4/U6 small nuclear ribonucleoprotein Prp31-like n=1 Tax=Corticium candelabrum TaxID=121492 RepID=UPI002E36D459|nr:U4/U6 small nuclear ribonucleoprotein Prp31-like [Corticium candelabrum]
MSLADELLADLEEIAEEGDIEDDAENKENGEGLDEGQEDLMDLDAIDTDSIRSIAKLSDSQQLKRVLEQIDFYTANPRQEEIHGPVEADPEYQLIVEANNVAVEIDHEIHIIHKFIRDHYSVRFPELDSLVLNPIDYMQTVKLVGNDLGVTNVDAELKEILPAASVMVISVTASTTQGKRIDDEDMEKVTEACDMGLRLNEAKFRIYEYVESRMAFIAPNLTYVIGPSIAAKLMGVAGGLTALSKMPSCNVLLLGAQRRVLAGFSSMTAISHIGFVVETDLVQNTSPDLRTKAARLVAGKCTLAARVDSFHESPTGSIGMSLRQEMEKKLNKLQEPPPVKQVKPLPRPDPSIRKKRGGRRVRRMKDKYAITEMRRQANRMTFGEVEDDPYQTEMGFNVGNVGKSGSGKVRAAVVDSKTQATISKRLQRKIEKQQQVYGGRSTVRGRETSGTASSVAFTPLQGLEIINPQAAEKRIQEANAKYFSNFGGFDKVKKGKEAVKQT